MKKVRILENGVYGNIPYCKDEIWEYVEDYRIGESVFITKDNKTTLVTIYNSNIYGKEAEFIEETEEIQLIL